MTMARIRMSRQNRDMLGQIAAQEQRSMSMTMEERALWDSTSSAGLDLSDSCETS
jgi:hypothetical protein